MKPKEWLFKNGHIKEIGRGRMSAAHIALINEAVANGVVIEGYSVVKDNKNETTAAPVVERVAIDPNRIADVPDMSRDERTMSAYYLKPGFGKVKVGMRTVCNMCGSSLTYCHCESPRVWVDYDRECVVNFVTHHNTRERP